MRVTCRILGGILVAIGATWLIYLFAEMYDARPVEPSAVQIASALAGAFFGLLIVGFGELYKLVAAIEANTRKQGSKGEGR